MEYELTRYGEEYQETLPTKLQRHHDSIRSQRAESATGRLKVSSNFYKLSRRQYLLDRIRHGQALFEPPAGIGAKRGLRYTSAMRKELASMLRDNLVKETPGWEQKIQVDLGHRHPGSVIATQEEYERRPPRRLGK